MCTSGEMLIGSRISLQIRPYVTTTQQIAKSCELEQDGIPRGRRRSTSPNLLPGSIVANASQEDMDTDEDGQGNKGEQTDGQEKYIKDFRVAAGDCQHSGLSLSVVTALAKHHQQGLRWGPKVHPKVRKSPQSALSFRGQYRSLECRKSPQIAVKGGKQRCWPHQRTLVHRSSMALDELRTAREFTQAELSQVLRVDQGSISKLERRTDMYIGTLRRYIEAMGGSLQIRAVFPDGEVQIKQFEDTK
jgi:Helix-turn-helix domain